MLLNDPCNLTEETKKRLNSLGKIHINVGNRKLTEEGALAFLEWFEDNKDIFNKNRIE